MCYQMIAGAVQMGAGQLGQIKGAQNSAMSNDANAEIAGMKKEDALLRGGIAEDAQRAKTRLIQGDQIAGMGSTGAVVGVGSNASILDQTAKLGEMDAQTVRSNSLREAWGFEIEKQNYLAAAAADRQNEEIQSGFLTAGQSLMPKWLSNIGNPGGALLFNKAGVKAHA